MFSAQNRKQLVLLLAFILSVALAAVFTLRAVRSAPHPGRGEPIQPWMNVPYIAHSYHVQANVLYRAISLPTAPRDRRPIAAIARAQHRPVDELITALQNAIMHARTPDLPPGPLPSTDARQHTP
jgi:hypothetical protein